MIRVESFQGVYQFVDTLHSATPNKMFAGSGMCASHDRSFSFSGTHSYKEAEDLMRNGYAEGCNAILKGSSKIPLKGGTRTNRKVDFVGGSPHIVNAIIGVPKTMIRCTSVPQPQKMIRIFYDCTASERVSKDVLFDGGGKLYALIKHLEMIGARVELHILCATTKQYDTAVVTIKVKDYRQPLNPMLMSYPLTHTSFFRRHILRWIETSECTSHAPYNKDYGCPTKHKACGAGKNLKEYLSSNNGCSRLLKGASILDCEKVAAATTIDELIKMLDIIK